MFNENYALQVNNAAVNYNIGSDNSVEFAQTVLATNYYGTKNVTKAMIPLMRPAAAGARVVNVSSRLGRLNGRRNVSNTFISVIPLSKKWMHLCFSYAALYLVFLFQHVQT